jgi:hypothetical protein
MPQQLPCSFFAANYQLSFELLTDRYTDGNLSSMSKAILRFPGGWTWTPILKNVATKLGLQVEPLEPTVSIDSLGLVQDHSVWVEMPIDRWIVAFRIVDQRGQPIVAELRVFPLEENAKRRRPAGQWTGIYGDKTPVPHGGITSTFLRNIKTNEFRAALRKIHTRFAQKLLDFDLSFVQPIRLPTSKPGPKGRPDSELARIAAIYQTALLDGRPPIRAVAQETGLSPSRARDAVGRARDKKLLSPADKQGCAGGTLTELGRELLEESMKGASHGKKR